MRFWTVLLACFAFGTAIVGCDEDEVKDPVTDAATMDSGDPNAGACENPTDEAGLMVTTYGDNGDQDASAVVRSCGIECLSNADPETCTSTCVDLTIGDAMTRGCKDCFLGSAVCLQANCLQECLGDPETCDACRCKGLGEAGTDPSCEEQFMDCTGPIRNKCG